MHHPPPAIPATGTLPGCFSPAMVAGLIRALPRPTAADAAELGRQTLHEVLAMISLYRPCDVIEALLVQQIAILHVRAPLAAALAAASEDTPESMVRYERHMMAQLRGAGALERRLGIYRREQAARGCAPAADEPWDYDLAAMEALWREAHTQQAAAGAPVAAAISRILPAIAAAPPITESSVRSALQSVISSTNPHGEIEVSAHAASGDGIGFGVFVPVGKSGACVHGWISTRDSNVAVDGISPDGGCLALLGA